ncbi:MAG TPA: M3 family metallopeptidase [Bacteroidales bacterium]|nr:M3 family metallopeptidase [Bacteroidales bacterium]MBP8709687.1 M3 family metallopeptidase [Bacteroidales bacterium]HNV66137.1 M3 family metallopeptidase [Bacteroidales bacterium]HNY58199.1 M3 family metallopeptidase [Bacteroidales bacterium]HOC04313.1 M3 family metallopeptidase [Bacteroidales bacterium]
MRRAFILIMAVALAAVSCNTQTKEQGNPFYAEWKTPFGVPPFDQIRNEHYLPAIDSGIALARLQIAEITANAEAPTFANTVAQYDRAGELMSKVAYVFYSQTSANTNDTLEALQMEIAPKMSAFSDEVLLNAELFSRIRTVWENRAAEELNDEELFLLENMYKSFVRNGALLGPEDQEILKKLNQELSLLTVKFSQNVLEETNSFRLVIDDEADLKGLPESVIAGAADEAKSAGMEGKWVFTTRKPSMIPFLQYADNRDMRKKLYDAYLNRGNNGNENDNNKILADIVRIRAERAKLLGYRTHADIVLETRMAKTPENVLNLLNNLLERSLRVAKRERDEMQKIADAAGGNFKLEPHDWWYYAEKLRKARYDLDENELRPYFRLDNVRDGAFAVANKLYGITFSPIDKIPLPHPDAQAFEVKEADGSHIGVLYMDFYPRESKRQGAWCGGYRDHKIVDGREITPVVTIVGNFTPPSGGRPALLSMDDVLTLFHEFGHGLQALFAENTYSSTTVAWDIVELPSQIMEHWATKPEVLAMYAKHYETGEVIPEALVEKIRNASYFNTGFDNVEIMAASLLDMAYYSLEAPVQVDPQQFEKETMKKIGLIPEIEPRYRSTYFLHMIDGYDAGYYVYTWAAVLDHDAFEAFNENGLFDQAIATSFRKNVLEKMGIMDAEKMYLNFRGREPEIEPLLRNRGLN